MMNEDEEKTESDESDDDDEEVWPTHTPPSSYWKDCATAFFDVKDD